MSGIAFVLKKSPILITNTGGVPKLVLNVDVEVSCWPCSLITGIVLPGLVHWFKKVNRLFNPSGVIAWNAGWKNFTLSVIDV